MNYAFDHTPMFSSFRSLSAVAIYFTKKRMRARCERAKCGRRGALEFHPGGIEGNWNIHRSFA